MVVSNLSLCYENEKNRALEKLSVPQPYLVNPRTLSKAFLFISSLSFLV